MYRKYLVKEGDGTSRIQPLGTNSTRPTVKAARICFQFIFSLGTLRVPMQESPSNSRLNILVTYPDENSEQVRWKLARILSTMPIFQPSE